MQSIDEQGDYGYYGYMMKPHLRECHPQSGSPTKSLHFPVSRHAPLGGLSGRAVKTISGVLVCD